MNPLLILNLPNQALSARHAIAYQLSHNQMPPGKGISDERARHQMLMLAREFEAVGDRALEFEEGDAR